MIEPLLPGAEGKRSRGRPTENDRQVLNGIFYVMRSHWHGQFCGKAGSNPYLTLVVYTIHTSGCNLR